MVTRAAIRAWVAGPLAKTQPIIARLAPPRWCHYLLQSAQVLMTKTVTLDRDLSAGAAAATSARVQRSDDNAMLRSAADLTRDLNVARPSIYWADMLGSALIGYAALFAVMASRSTRSEEHT